MPSRECVQILQSRKYCKSYFLFLHMLHLTDFERVAADWDPILASPRPKAPIRPIVGFLYTRDGGIIREFYYLKTMGYICVRVPERGQGHGIAKDSPRLLSAFFTSCPHRRRDGKAKLLKRRGKTNLARCMHCTAARTLRRLVLTRFRVL